MNIPGRAGSTTVASTQKAAPPVCRSVKELRQAAAERRCTLPLRSRLPEFLHGPTDWRGRFCVKATVVLPARPGMFMT